MSDILNAIGQFIGAAISWMQSFLGAITETATNGTTTGTTLRAFVLIIFVICVPLVGLGIGLLRRLIKTRG